jgi:SAM-dependent methyltransferase
MPTTIEEAPRSATRPVPGWSVPATSRRVLELLAPLDWRTARIADVGAGRGHFSHVLSLALAERGLDPAQHVFPCDLIPASFEAPGLACRPTGEDGRLPFDDASLDAAVSIEVVEHVEDRFAFLRELRRVVRPGGLVIVTTPNTLNASSRVRALTWGFPLLYDPLPLATHDPRRLGGHIHPVSPYFLAYAALRAGLADLSLHPARTKASAVGWTVLLAPFLLAGRLRNTLRLRAKPPDVLAENRALIRALCGFGLLTSRTAVLRARRPEA